MANQRNLTNVLKDSESERDSIYGNRSINYGSDYQTTPIYNERTLITKQPVKKDLTGSRCPLPISTISNNQNYTSGHVIPYSGIQLLNDINQVNIEQTVELNTLTSLVESENRFLIKGDHGQVLFNGMETSPTWERILCCSARGFTFKLFDRSNQEALYFNRRLACSSPFVSCYLQKVNVFVPYCDFIGSIKQLWTPAKTTLAIRNSNDIELFQIRGSICCQCTKLKDAEFTVYDSNNSTPVTTISHHWNDQIMNYEMTVNFPPRTNFNNKALIIGCAILLEYMYFDISTNGSCLTCFK